MDKQTLILWVQKVFFSKRLDLQSHSENSKRKYLLVSSESNIKAIYLILANVFDDTIGKPKVFFWREEVGGCKIVKLAKN